MSSRGARVGEAFAADRAFSRQVTDLAEAVDSVKVDFVPVARYLAALREGPAERSALGQRLNFNGDELDAGLERLEDLGLLEINETEGREQVALTAAGQQAAESQAAERPVESG